MRFLLASILALAIFTVFSSSEKDILESLSILNPLDGDEIQSGHSIIFEVLLENLTTFSSTDTLSLFLNDKRLVSYAREELAKHDGVVKWDLEGLIPGTYIAAAEVLDNTGMIDLLFTMVFKDVIMQNLFNTRLSKRQITCQKDGKCPVTHT
jgi:hypothetical protein